MNENNTNTNAAREAGQIEQLTNRAIQLEGSMSQGEACYAACREAGIAESEVPSTAAIVSTMVTNRAINVGVPALTGEALDRFQMKLRGKDRIEGDEVVLVFKKGREVRMSRAEWKNLVATKHEPHAIASSRL